MEASLYIATTIKDRDGEVIHRTVRRPSRSYIQGWEWLICAQFLGSSNPSTALGPVMDVTGTNRNLRTCGIPFRCNGLAATPDPGIRIGTSDAPVMINQHGLQAIISQGVGVSMVEHQAQTYFFTGVVGNQCSFLTSRVFVNNSGALINVRETGLYMTGYDSGTQGRTFMVARDLISEDVPDGGSVTITYTVRILV